MIEVHVIRCRENKIFTNIPDNNLFQIRFDIILCSIGSIIKIKKLKLNQNI